MSSGAEDETPNCLTQDDEVGEVGTDLGAWLTMLPGRWKQRSTSSSVMSAQVGLEDLRRARGEESAASLTLDLLLLEPVYA